MSTFFSAEPDGDGDCSSFPLHVVMIYITVQLGVILAIVAIVFLIAVIWRYRRNGTKTAQTCHVELDSQSPPPYEDAAQGALLEVGMSSDTSPTPLEPPPSSTPTVTETPPTSHSPMSETMTHSDSGSVMGSSRQLL